MRQIVKRPAGVGSRKRASKKPLRGNSAMDILGMPKVGVKKLSNSRRGRKEPQSLDEVAINLQISQEIIKECQNAEAIRKAIRAGKLVTMPFSQILSL